MHYFTPLAWCLLTLFAALSIAYVAVASSHVHGRLTFDNEQGIQKIHREATPRIGGLAIFLATLICNMVQSPQNPITTKILLALVPAFTIGFFEDLTKRIPPAARLLGTITSAVIAIFLTDTCLTSVGIPGIDSLFSLSWFSVAFTAIAVAGLSNAYNIIDGYNGLAGLSAIISLLGIGLIALKVEDQQLAMTCFVFASATCGFLCLNWPRGRIFLGDGGSYLLGFVVGWLSVMLVERNANISAFAMLVVCIHPVTEVLHSIFRRTLMGQALSCPDRFHLHSLFGTRCVDRWFTKQSLVQRNSIAGFLLALHTIPMVLAATLYYDLNDVCIIICIAYAVGYCFVHNKLVLMQLT